MHLPSLQQSFEQQESFPSLDFIGQESLSLQQFEEDVEALIEFVVYAKAAIENAKSIKAATEMMNFFFIVYFPFYIKSRF